jgi:hypothetical protein
MYIPLCGQFSLGALPLPFIAAPKETHGEDFSLLKWTPFFTIIPAASTCSFLHPWEFHQACH